jgi:very-short-patch-repair endonuclease
MGEENALADLNIARIAAGQHGVVASRQLEAAGVGKNAITKRVRNGQLHRLHRGVYAVGHRGLSLEGRWMAAVLACGPGAVLSYMSAAALWGLLRPEAGPIDVSLPSQSGRSRREGLRIHRCASLAVAAESEGGAGSWDEAWSSEREARATLVTVRRGIPVTTVARIVHDLERTAAPHLVRRATRQAQLAGFTLGTEGIRARTRSDLEDDFLAFCRRHRIPSPAVNVKVGRWTVDFLWPRQRLVVETDFYNTHRGSVAFEDDHQRDLELRRIGYAVHRYTGAQLRGHPAEIAAELGEVLEGGAVPHQSRRSPAS